MCAAQSVASVEGRSHLGLSFLPQILSLKSVCQGTYQCYHSVAFYVQFLAICKVVPLASSRGAALVQGACKKEASKRSTTTSRQRTSRVFSTMVSWLWDWKGVGLELALGGYRCIGVKKGTLFWVHTDTTLCVDVWYSNLTWSCTLPCCLFFSFFFLLNSILCFLDQRMRFRVGGSSQVTRWCVAYFVALLRAWYGTNGRELLHEQCGGPSSCSVSCFGF